MAALEAKLGAAETRDDLAYPLAADSFADEFSGAPDLPMHGRYLPRQN